MCGLKKISELISLAALTIALSHCASSQQSGDQAAEQIAAENGLGNTVATNASLNGGNGTTPGNKSAMGEQMNNAVSGGSTNNFAGSNSGNIGGNGGNIISNSALGESLNNVPINNPAATASNTPPLLNTPLNNAAAPLNQGATNLAATGLNTAAPTNAANAAPPQNNAAAVTEGKPAVPESTNSNARAEASPFKNPQMNWPGKGKVKYATRAITRHASPNGPVVGEFEQGEHPLVYQNGNWVELHDGSFVKGNGLSDKAVGYSKGKSNWR